jgi:hypothetical protein
MSASNMIPLEELQISALPARGITKDTCTKLKYSWGSIRVTLVKWLATMMTRVLL